MCRVVLAGVTVPTLAFSEIDEIMSTIDLIRPELLHDPHGDGPVSQSFQCFGVFDANITNSPHTQPNLLHTEACSPATTASSGSPPVSLPTYSAESSGSAISLDAPNCPDMASNMSSNVDSLLGIEYFDPCPFDPEDIPIPPGSSLDLFGGALSYNDLRIAFNSFQDAFSLHGRDQQFQSNESSHEGSDIVTRQDQSLPNIPSAPSFKALSNEETFLMHHYATKVVHLFVALDNPKSPWQTIHLPRALQSAGELLVCNSTSGIRHSLRSSLLAISAFCLSNDYKIVANQDLAQKWNRRGTYYRGKALMHLKQVVESGISMESRPKYKEVLATMLSMVSINVCLDLPSCPGSHTRFSNVNQVMSGDTETCGVHLDGARKFIDQAKSWKVRYSNKALALHRIYFYLHTMYQSTIVTNKAGGRDYSSPALSQSPAAEISGVLESDASAPSSSSPSQSNHTMSTYTHVYAIPASLLALLDKTIGVVNKVVEERERFKARALSLGLASICDELESCIMDWHEDKIDHLCGTESHKKSANLVIAHHTTRAFYNAIIIYFIQHVRLLRHHYIQPFILKVIDSLEAIERIKTESEILATPLYWPAFIAASEAFRPALQQRFKDWYKQVERYGIESVRTGIDVLAAVWEEGPCPGQTLTSIWRLVVQRSGATLILS